MADDIFSSSGVSQGTRDLAAKKSTEYAAAQARYNYLVEQSNSYKKTWRAQQAQLDSPAGQANAVLKNDLLRAQADQRAVIDRLAPEIAKSKAAADQAQLDLNNLHAMAVTEQSAANQAKATATQNAAVQPSGTDLSNDPEIVITGKRPVVAYVPKPDHRIRLSAYGGQETIVYGIADKTKNILAPLHATGGLVFPYTPTVQVSQDTTWQSADLEHANYDILSFQKASSTTFSVSGKFTVQNQMEGEYLLAAIHFLRTVSKAYFGAQDVEKFVAPQQPNSDASPDNTSEAQITKERKNGRAGLPPPVLLLSGYGTMMFNDIRVVVKSHSWSYDEASDLVKIDLANERTVWLPPMMTISLALGMQQNTDKLREDFSLDSFRTGELLKKRGWF